MPKIQAENILIIPAPKETNKIIPIDFNILFLLVSSPTLILYNQSIDAKDIYILVQV